MAVNEQIVTGRKFRKLIDETSKLWQRISFWTKASDVEFNDGKNLEEKINELNNKLEKIEKSIIAINTDLPFKAVKTNSSTFDFTSKTR
ncbi:MAG: hypothetical protein J1E64_10710 [Acetatifactor sp.]|nr:hypothetical protein [Acetatifactor sp.]